MKFYYCKTCKNIVYHVSDEHAPVMCCGEVMKELTANTVDASQEKHVPVVKQNGNVVLVEVGSVIHPMLDEHYIEWICLETNKGVYFKYLKPNNMPRAKFTLEEDEVVLSVYEHCNLHGLWKK